MAGSARHLRTVVGRRISALRKSAGLTQREVAERSSIDMKYFGAIEKGRKNVTIATLERIARVLAVDPFELLIPMGRAAREKPKETDRLHVLFERLDESGRDTILRVVETFADYHPRPPRARSVGRKD
jgi:transcriptional regulator with XRE-family HTH domain